MKISVKEFKAALEVVKPGLASAEKVIEQVTSFAFTDKNVITYNDEICIQHPFKGLELVGAIKAEELYKFLTKIKSEELDVNVDEEKVTFKSGRAKVEFNLEGEIKLPLDDKKLNEKSKWKDIPENFLAALAMARGSVSKDMSDPKLTCVSVNKEGFVEGSDGDRILHYKVGEKLPCDSVLIPASSVSNVLNLKPTEVAKGNGWIHFRNANKTVISCRVLNEGYVNTEPYLKTEEKGIKINLPEELASVLDTAEIFTKGDDVTIQVKKSKLVIKATSETASFKDELDIEKSKSEFSFGVTPYLLKDILKQTSSCTIFKDRLLFKGDNWKYVTTLNSLEEE